MPNYIAFNAWEGFAPLAEYNSKRASHARIVVLLYIALRSASGYFWGEIENVAEDIILSRGETGRLIKDLETIGALRLTAHDEIPKDIKELIETSHPLKPAKKVWRVTGRFTIDGKVYLYEWTGDGGSKKSSNVQLVNTSNVQLVKCSLSEHNSIEIDIEEKIENKKTLVEPLAEVTTATDVSATPQIVIDGRFPCIPIPVEANRNATPQHPLTQTVALDETTTPPSSDIPPTPKAKTPLIVNLSNEKLGRARPQNYTDAEYEAWLKAKPVWELFADWQVMNLTNGNCHYADYETKAHPLEWQRIVNEVQLMGKWLQALAQKAKITLSYEWVLGWKRWYDATVMNDDITKYPTRKDTFHKNFTLYVDYLYQQSKKEPNQ